MPRYTCTQGGTVEEEVGSRDDPRLRRVMEVFQVYRQHAGPDRRKLTEEDLAHELALSRQHINTLLNCQKYPSMPTFFRLMDILKVKWKAFEETSNPHIDAILEMLPHAEKEYVEAVWRGLEVYLEQRIQNRLNDDISRNQCA